MFKRVIQQMRLFALLFEMTPPMNPYAVLPGIVMLLSYPILTAGMASDTAFITAFLLTYATRVVLFGGGAMERAWKRSAAVGAVYAAAIMPVVMVVLIWGGSPLWCMRFYTVFMLVVATGYLLDVGGPGYEVTRCFFTHKAFEPSYPMLAWAMVIYHLAMALLNETMIAGLSRPAWMMFFASLPLIEHMIRSALVLTVLLEREDLR